MYLTSISCDAGTEALFGSASSCVPNPLPFFFFFPFYYKIMFHLVLIFTDCTFIFIW